MSTITRNIIRYCQIFGFKHLIFEILCLEEGNKPPTTIPKLKISVAENYNFDFRKLLEQIDPDLIIDYDESFLLNAALKNIAHSMAIPTLYLSHGYNGSTPSKRRFPFLALYRKVLRYLRFAHIYKKSTANKFRYTWPLLKKLWRLIRFNEQVFPTVMLPGFKCDTCVIYDEKTRDVQIQNKGYFSDNVLSLPHPDAANHFNKPWIKAEKKLIYIAQPLVELQLVSNKDFIEFAINLRKACFGYELIIRPHPKSDINILRQAFGDLCLDDDNSRRSASYVIGHTSTLLIEISATLPVFTIPIKGIEDAQMKFDIDNPAMIKCVLNDLEVRLNEKPTLKYQEFHEHSTKKKRCFYKELVRIIDAK
jgi:hypothetical protein